MHHGYSNPEDFTEETDYKAYSKEEFWDIFSTTQPRFKKQEFEVMYEVSQELQLTKEQIQYTIQVALTPVRISTSSYDC